ncbi:NUDIX domain-containing protein [Streptomyces sp. NPDC101225]|uniref:NUDIX domain-containing protein n=1 Tax=Streptomyces sp. NPDC101225 TaxID=3366135 RepID=UPI0038026993
MIECVRAVLITPADRLLPIRRTRPGGIPCRTLPGGHVEPDDLDLRAALTRGVREETGGTPDILGRLLTFDDSHQRDHVPATEPLRARGRSGARLRQPLTSVRRPGEILAAG